VSRPPRIEFAGAVHHVTARGDRREEIFRDDRDRSKFLGYLSEGAKRYKVKVHCYVLMENHFHLVATTADGNLSKWMHQLKTAYTVFFNRRHQVLGGEGFLRKLKDHWNQRVQRPKNYGQKRNWSTLGAEQVLARVSQHFQCDLERLKERSSRNNVARRCAITLCWDHAGLSHNEIAALFRMPSNNSVAQTIRRTKVHEAQTLKVLKNQISHK